MEEEKHKKKMILAIIGAIILVAGIVGLTIAYFRAQAESKDIVVSSKKLSIVFSDPEGSLIRASDIEPIADEDIDTLGTKKTFTIAKKDAADKDVYLRLELTDLTVSDNFKDSDLRWALYKSGSIVTEGSFVNVKSSTSLPLANNILLDSTTPEEYNLYIWIHETGVDQERLMGGSLSGKITVTGTENIQEGIVNEGKLAEGMIPVVYDETNNVWVKAGGDLGWYDYSKQEWANAVAIYEIKRNCYEWDGITGDVTGAGYLWDRKNNIENIPEPDGDLSKEDSEMIINSFIGGSEGDFSQEEWLRRADYDGNGEVDTLDGSKILGILDIGICTEETRNNKTKEEYLAAPAGTIISPINTEFMYTWIPRYKYRINNTGSTALPSMIDVEFESGVTSTGVSINTSGVAKTEYYTHPAFRDGSKVYKETPYDQSGWDKELSGFWVDKFDNLGTYDISADAMVDYTITDYVDNYEWLNSDYSPKTKAEYHMIKNTEWGAIAYLSQSKYGKMGNTNFTGANKEIYINGNSQFISGRSGGSPNAASFSGGGYRYNGFECIVTLCPNNQDILKGTGASTTGTVYGVYDMNGNANEYVMSNYNNSLASSGLTADFFTNEANKKYYDSYNSSKTYILGDATHETSGWYNDTTGTLGIDEPFLVRGGAYDGGANSGIFSYGTNTGDADTKTSTRYILTR